MMADHTHIRGLHHVTAIASGAQANVDFYTRVLGLRLVKRTVNFDAPETYHFYYGDSAGRPGSLLTFLPFEYAAAGSIGAGMADTTAFCHSRGGVGRMDVHVLPSRGSISRVP